MNVAASVVKFHIGCEYSFPPVLKASRMKAQPLTIGSNGSRRSSRPIPSLNLSSVRANTGFLPMKDAGSVEAGACSSAAGAVFASTLNWLAKSYSTSGIGSSSTGRGGAYL